MVDPHSAPARSRPGVVTISTYLLILFALTQVISLIITLSTIGTIRKVLEEAYRGTSANGVQNVADIAFAAAIGTSVLLLVLSLGLVVLGIFNNRGSNGARIATWILGGILVCCTGGNLLGGLTGGFRTTGSGTTGDVPSGEEIQRRLEAELPSWITPVSILLGVIGLVSLLAALILLALPKANEFFRKPKQAWEPPVPGASYPGYPPAPGQPGYPPAPSYPPAPGQPGYPPAPGQPGYPQAPGYPSTPGYPQTPDYPQAPGQPGYPQAPGYPPPPGYPQAPGQPSAPGQPWAPGQPGGAGEGRPEQPSEPRPEQPGEAEPGSDRPGPTQPPVS